MPEIIASFVMDYVACKGQRFGDVFDTKLLAGRKICIAEKGLSSADFIIADLAVSLQYPIISFYDTKDHYRSVLKKYYGKEDIQVVSWIEGDKIFLEGGIIDDAITMEKAGYVPTKNSVIVYRSDTCKVCDYYSFDLVFEISSLKSGISVEADGIIDYMNSWGYKVEFYQVESVKASFDGIKDVIEKSLEFEKLVLKHLKEVYAEAEEAQDYPTTVFLEPYVMEQITSIKQLNGYLMDAQRCSGELGEFLFDKVFRKSKNKK